jgi:hypothetical protein
LRGGLVAGAKISTTLIPLFAKKFFHAVRTHGGTNEVDRTNILAPGLPRSIEHDPSSRLHRLRMLSEPIGSWEVVSSYSSATAPDSHGISCADPRIKLAKNCVQE